MNDDLLRSTRIVSYFLWEHTGSDRALGLWYCAEDLACYFEQMGILDVEKVDEFRKLGVNDPSYVHFMRHIAFRIYLYTGCDDADTNWYTAERLVKINEWATALVETARIYRNGKADRDFIAGFRSENVRAFYDEQTSKDS